MDVARVLSRSTIDSRFRELRFLRDESRRHVQAKGTFIDYSRASRTEGLRGGRDSPLLIFPDLRSSVPPLSVLRFIFSVERESLFGSGVYSCNSLFKLLSGWYIRRTGFFFAGNAA